MVLGTSDMPSPQAGGGGVLAQSGPRRSSSTGGSSMGDPCSCSECGSSDEDPALEVGLFNGDANVKNRSSMLPVLHNPSSTVLDMQVLDAHESRKMKDDSKVHHILEDAMFKPRKRFHRHHRHMLPNESHNNALYHHNVRKNMHHILSHSLRTKHGIEKHHGHSKKQLTEEIDKPRKNVSFANAADVGAAAGAGSEKNPLDDRTPATLTNGTKPTTSAEVSEEKTANDFSGSSDDGITFTVRKSKEVEDQPDAGPSVRGAHHSSHSKTKSKNRHSSKSTKPTLTERTLPWRSAASLEDPVSMESILVMNADDQPCPGEAPSWVEVDGGFPSSPHKTGVLYAARHSDPDFLETLELANGSHGDGPFVSTAKSADSAAPLEPDIVNYSLPTEPLWTQKINDFHEHFGHEGLAAVTYADLVASAAPAQSFDAFDGPETPMSGPDDCYLPATWRTNDELSPRHERSEHAEGVASETAAMGQQTNLPPPWKNCPDNGEDENETDSAQKSNVLFELGPPSESTSARSLPWETATGDVVLDMDDTDGDCALTSDIDQSSMRCLSTDSVPDTEDCLPPPWRSVNVSEASIPVRSPSASHELDSLVPQASHNSLRLSEAESRHSEQFRGHHHVIDIVPREIEQSSSSSGVCAVIGDETEPLDLVSRVQRWLLDTKLDQQDPVLEDLYDAGVADVAGTAADLSDATDCEDTYL